MVTHSPYRLYEKPGKAVLSLFRESTLQSEPDFESNRRACTSSSQSRKLPVRSSTCRLDPRGKTTMCKTALGGLNPTTPMLTHERPLEPVAMHGVPGVPRE